MGRFHNLLPTCAVLVLAIGACGRKADVKSTTAELEKVFSVTSAVPVVTAPSVNPAPSAPAAADDLVKSALAAARANDFAAGVIALEAAQRKPGVTAEQVMAAQRAMQAMNADLARRAAAGDAQALAQLKAIEKTRSQ